MNLYVRYYDGEAVVSSIDELIYSLKQFGVPESVFDDDFMDEVYEFTHSKAVHPKRFRVSPRQYFILIKTNVNSLAEFKANAKRNAAGVPTPKNDRLAILNEICPGWYDGQITFKRVVFSSLLNKFQYKDTTFRARVKAQSAIDCYNRIVLYLRNRQDVDPRSQFPSAKGRNYSYTFLGDNIPNACGAISNSKVDTADNLGAVADSIGAVANTAVAMDHASGATATAGSAMVNTGGVTADAGNAISNPIGAMANSIGAVANAAIAMDHAGSATATAGSAMGTAVGTATSRDEITA